MSESVVASAVAPDLNLTCPGCGHLIPKHTAIVGCLFRMPENWVLRRVLSREIARLKAMSRLPLEELTLLEAAERALGTLNEVAQGSDVCGCLLSVNDINQLYANWWASGDHQFEHSNDKT